MPEEKPKENKLDFLKKALKQGVEKANETDVKEPKLVLPENPKK